MIPDCLDFIFLNFKVVMFSSLPTPPDPLPHFQPHCHFTILCRSIVYQIIHILNSFIFVFKYCILTGVTTDEDWNMKIKILPAPWTEIEIPGLIILTVPTSTAATISDMNAVGLLYFEIMTSVNKLAGIEIRQRAERFVFDIQISAGSLFDAVAVLVFALFFNFW